MLSGYPCPPDAPIHDPASRHLLLERGSWSVRTVPGGCPAQPIFMRAGLWHLQFFHAQAHISVLSFPRLSRLGPFLVSADGWRESWVLDGTGLDRVLLERGVPRTAASLAAFTELMAQRSLESLLLIHAARGGRRVPCAGGVS